jgi:hypothetical protein
MIESDELVERFAALQDKQPIDDYNFKHFRLKHFLIDGRRTIEGHGLQPGQHAPDFELPHVGTENTLRLSDLRGKPVLLHFGSFT